MPLPQIPVARDSLGHPIDAPELLGLSALSELECLGYLAIELPYTDGSAVDVVHQMDAPTGASIATVSIEAPADNSDDVAMRYRSDSVNPTSAVTGGNPLYHRSSIDYDADMSGIKMLAMRSGVVVHIEFYGRKQNA